MAEYQLDVTSDRDRWETLDTFTHAYIECAFWTLDVDGYPLDYLGLHDLSQKALDAMRADCRAFQDAHGERISSDLSRAAGHDFWLTRNRHGAGFWDGDWPESDASTLTDDAHAYGESDLYLGDDGALYLFP